LPEFEQLPDIETTSGDVDFPEPLEFEPIADLELDPEPLDSHVPGLVQTGSTLSDSEPAFDLSLNGLDVAPLEGLESAADPDSFAIDPAANNGEAPVEGLIQGEPGLGDPINDQDPLSGLNVLEDDRFFVHDTDPLAGLGGQEDEEVSTRSSFDSSEDDEPVAAVGHAELEVDTFELDNLEADEEAAEEEESRAEDERAEANARKAAAERARKAEEEKQRKADEEKKRKPATPRRVARKTPPRTESDEIEDDEDSRAGQERLKQSRLKVVQPVRPTRPKPKTEEAKPQPSQAGKRPVNPFLRPRKEVPSEPSPPKASPRVPTPPEEVPKLAAAKKTGAPGDDKFVDLADWLREDTGPRSYRMVASDDKRIGEEQADFTDMLEKFKAGVAANVDDEDFDSHYDLGVAYREMGLIDEAVAEFQKALRGSAQRLRAYEALGQCFIDRGEYDVAITTLSRALREPGLEDEDLIGVLYLLGFASEEGKKPRDAAAYYQRVFAVDVDFRDVSKRLKHMGKAASK
jgi:tetratricopeptide (TPR) repeat protein